MRGEERGIPVFEGGGKMNIMERAIHGEGGVRYLLGERIHNGYYHLYDGRVLHSEKGLQSLLVLENPLWKRILFINGIMQFTLKDEFIYHEALVHIPAQLFSEGRLKRVLICGGGDLGAAREVLKYKEVEEVVIADIDKRVTEIVKEYFPEILPSSTERITIHHVDAFKIVKQYAEEGKTFDLVIVDSTDPDISSDRPLELSHSLFGKEFHQLLKRLVPEGVVVQQAGAPFTMKNILEACYATFREVYSGDKISCYRTNIPSFGGDSAFVIRSALGDPAVPVREMVPETKYYTHEIHRASFVLPKFWGEAIKDTGS